MIKVLNDALTNDIISFEQMGPGHDKTYNKTCVTSKYSDQPVHPPSVARILCHPSLDSLEAVEGNAISEDSDKTARMRRLI